VARRLAAALAALAVLAFVPLTNASADGPPFEVWHTPPGLILRGEAAVVHVNWQTTDGELPPSAFVFVRDDQQTEFTRLRLFGGTRRVIPAKFLDGRYVEDYVVVHDSGTSVVRRVPAAGAFRSWIRDSFHVVDLGKHQFGHVRAPNAIVARAAIGDGPHQAAWFCPPEGLCEYPWSFDVGPSGQVWMLDPHHERILGWFPGHPQAPSRTIPIDFGPADLAIGADGTVFVSGVKIGDPADRLRLYAFAPNGDLQWHSHLLAQIFNDHIRFGPDGVLYSVDPLYGWAPAVGADGEPLPVAEQRRLARPDEPLPGDLQLVTRGRSEHEQRAALATEGGELRRAWRITSDNVFDGGAAIPAAVDGDPVLAFGVFDFRRHLMENLILRLSKTDGVVRRFSLGRGVEGGAEVTTLRVGSGGAVYQLQGSPDDGFVRVARYSLAAG